MNPETSFKKALRARFHGFSFNVEPSRGSDVGVPDTFFCNKGVLQPVEIKVGFLSDKILEIKRPGIRPSQLSWGHRFEQEGGTAIYCVGIRLGKEWSAAILNQTQALKWPDGYAEQEIFTLEQAVRKIIG